MLMVDSATMPLVSFGGKIRSSLKDSIDAKLEETRVPIGVAVERLAEFLAGMEPEEIKMFCFGTNATTFAGFIERQVAAFFRSDAGAAVIDEAVAARTAQEFVRTREHRRSQSRRPAG